MSVNPFKAINPIEQLERFRRRLRAYLRRRAAEEEADRHGLWIWSMVLAGLLTVFLYAGYREPGHHLVCKPAQVMMPGRNSLTSFGACEAEVASN